MRVIIFLFISLLIASCNNKKKKKIDKKAFKEGCIYQFTDTGALDDVIERKNAYRVCDCVTENVVKLYNSEEEIDRDTAGFRKLVSQCVDKVQAELAR